MSQDDVAATMGALYEAALEPERWPAALDRLRQLFGGAASVVFLQDLDKGEVPVWLGIGTAAGKDEYLNSIHAINPRVHFSLAEPPGHIAWDYRVVSEERIRRDPFYDWLGRMHGYRYFMGARMFELDGLTAFTSIEWTVRQGHVQRPAIALYRKVLPHIAQALRLTISRGDSLVRAATLEAILNGFECGIIVLDHRGHVLFVNAEAEGALRRNDGLGLVHGELRTDKAADTRRLDAFIAQALCTAAGGELHAATSMPVRRRGQVLPYIVTVAPLAIEPLPGMVERPAAAVIIHECRIDVGPSARHLEQLFGLSPREAALGAAFGRGQSLPEAARATGMSYNTARVHMQNIFVKTGVRSQTDLARLLVSLSSLSGGGPAALP